MLLIFVPELKRQYTSVCRDKYSQCVRFCRKAQPNCDRLADVIQEQGPRVIVHPKDCYEYWDDRATEALELQERRRQPVAPETRDGAAPDGMDASKGLSIPRASMSSAGATDMRPGRTGRDGATSITGVTHNGGDHDKAEIARA